MSIINKVFTIERLHKLIKSEFIGAPVKYAERLNISRSTLYNYIDELECEGAVITFSRLSNKFIYLNDFEFEIYLKYSIMDDKDIKKIKGGTILFSYTHY